MDIVKKIFFLGLFCISFTLYSHNPEKLVISEIERGQLNFENEKIAAEYGAALKRQRIRKLSAMPLANKMFIFIKAGFEHILPLGLDHILFVLGLFFSTIKLLLSLITIFFVIIRESLKTIFFKKNNYIKKLLVPFFIVFI